MYKEEARYRVRTESRSNFTDHEHRLMFEEKRKEKKERLQKVGLRKVEDNCCNWRGMEFLKEHRSIYNRGGFSTLVVSVSRYFAGNKSGRAKMKAAKATKPITSAFAQRRSNSMNEKRKNHGWREEEREGERRRKKWAD